MRRPTPEEAAMTTVSSFNKLALKYVNLHIDLKVRSAIVFEFFVVVGYYKIRGDEEESWLVLSTLAWAIFLHEHGLSLYIFNCFDYVLYTTIKRDGIYNTRLVILLDAF
jgi:hypothetical protein